MSPHLGLHSGCLLWVKMGPRSASQSSPFIPQQQTCSDWRTGGVKVPKRQLIRASSATNSPIMKQSSHYQKGRLGAGVGSRRGCDRSLTTQGDNFYFHVTFQKTALGVSRCLDGSASGGAGQSKYRGGPAKFRSSFPGPSMGKCDKRFPRSRRSGCHWPGGLGHLTTRTGWSEPVCIPCSWVPSALPDST